MKYEEFIGYSLKKSSKEKKRKKNKLKTQKKKQGLIYGRIT